MILDGTAFIYHFMRALESFGKSSTSERVIPNKKSYNPIYAGKYVGVKFIGIVFLTAQVDGTIFLLNS